MRTAAPEPTADRAPAARPVMPAGAPAWVTPELLGRTRAVWGRRAGTAVGPDEALAILLRVGTLLDVLHRR